MGTGTTPMTLEFKVLAQSGISSEPEVRVWLICNGEEEETQESIAASCLM